MAKIVVGNRTKVIRVVLGTPISRTVIATNADIDDIVGVDTTGAQNGALLVYNDSSGVWEATNNYTFEDSVIDGKVYPGNTARQKILIRRSGTAGDPLILRTGEFAYSWLPDSSTNGFGNGGDRLYIGTGLEVDSAGIIRASRIDTVGGRYFTNLLNHQHGILTPASALIVDSNSRVNNFKTINLLADSATITNYLRVNGDLLINNITLSEYIDSDVNQLLEEGEAIDITYSDSNNTLIISAELASLSNRGVASFGAWADSAETLRQFSVDSGAVSIIRIDGGYLDWDSTLP